MIAFTDSYLFGITLSLAAFLLGKWVSKKTGAAWLNPLLLAAALIIALLSVTRIPLANYKKGAQFISMLLCPATASLAVSIYNQRKILKEYFLIVVVGCLFGALASMGSVYLLCRLFGLNTQLTVTLLPKSVTTAIAMPLSESMGGIPSVTAAVVVLTGVLGAVTAPLLVKLFHVSDPLAQGLAIGACSHAIGTTKAMELGETQGAISSVAIGVEGLITTLFVAILF